MTPDRLPRIGIDGYNLALPQGTGVATYGRILGQAVHGMGHPVDLIFGVPVPKTAPDHLREAMFFARLHQDDPFAPVKQTLKGKIKWALTSPRKRELIEVPRDGRIVVPELLERLPPHDRLFTLGSLFRVAGRHFRRYGRFLDVVVPNPPEIMHWTYPVPVKMEGAANIYTLHDLVPLRLPHTTLEDKGFYHHLIGSCIAQADRICTVSEVSRRDILDIYPQTDPGKVINTYQAAALGDAAPPGDEDLARRLSRMFGLQADGYFLFFAAIEPKKNLARLIEAYLSADIDRPLVIVGKEAWQADQELRLLRDAGGGRRDVPGIRRIDYLPRHQLALLVRGARAVCMPSLYEGFGLPALEAMVAGRPVLGSTTGSLPEVVGDGGLTVDPYDVTALAAALRQLDQDDALVARLSAAALRQAENFSMTRYQERLRELYRPYC